MSPAAPADEQRFEFGKNWSRFVRRNFSQERCDTARRKILDFLGRDSLDGLDFLDIGCGSGLHSLAAFQAGAGQMFSLDYDENSVSATRTLREYAGSPQTWKVERGDVLDDSYVESLGKWNFVYSWGVLHHTGNVWKAIENAQKAVADGGLFYIALYSADVFGEAMMKFWIEKKQEYNRSSRIKKNLMVLWYIWRFGLGGNLRRLPQVLKQIYEHKTKRGMNYFTDVHDWLGGWPMEFTGDQEVVDFLEQKHGFQLINVATGEACSEFLFERSGKPAERTIVTELAAEKKSSA